MPNRTDETPRPDSASVPPSSQPFPGLVLIGSLEHGRTAWRAPDGSVVILNSDNSVFGGSAPVPKTTVPSAPPPVSPTAPPPHVIAGTPSSPQPAVQAGVGERIGKLSEHVPPRTRWIVAVVVFTFFGIARSFNEAVGWGLRIGFIVLALFAAGALVRRVRAPQMLQTLWHRMFLVAGLFAGGVTLYGNGWWAPSLNVISSSPIETLDRLLYLAIGLAVLWVPGFVVAMVLAVASHWYLYGSVPDDLFAAEQHGTRAADSDAAAMSYGLVSPGRWIGFIGSLPGDRKSYKLLDGSTVVLNADGTVYGRSGPPDDGTLTSVTEASTAALLVAPSRTESSGWIRRVRGRVSQRLRWPPSRRQVIGAVAVLGALYVLGPQPHVTWTAGTSGVPSVYSCPAGYHPYYPNGAPPADGGFRDLLGPSQCQSNVAENIFLGSLGGVTGPTLITRGVPAVPERHRLALYFVGPRWRLFDIDFSTGTSAGFGTDATYH